MCANVMVYSGESVARVLMYRQIVQETTQRILERRQDVVRLAAAQRSKFEHWLKFELAADLGRMPGVGNVRLEAPYGAGKDRADVSFTADGAIWHVELKTSNVNWRVAGVENRTRPITMNITSIIEDVRKLRVNCANGEGGLAAFVLFPIPMRIWQQERPKLGLHLGRIERESGLTPGSLAANAGFVNFSADAGLGVFAVEAAAPKLD